MELSGFLNELDDMIRYTPDLIPTMARYRNFGTQTAPGRICAMSGSSPLAPMYPTRQKDCASPTCPT